MFIFCMTLALAILAFVLGFQSTTLIIFMIGFSTDQIVNAIEAGHAKS
jgi:hypothetical protein